MRVAKYLTPGMLALCIPLIGCEQEVSFAGDVQPILNDSCINCHGGAGEGSETSGVDLTSYEGVMRGTNLGAIVVAGSAESSALYLVSARKTSPEIHMPPHTDDSLAEGRGFSLREPQIQTIADWINQGARNN